MVSVFHAIAQEPPNPRRTRPFSARGIDVNSASTDRFISKSNRELATLQARERDGRPIRVGIVGAGAYGRTLVSQLVPTPGLRAAVICDTDIDAARNALIDSCGNGVDVRVVESGSTLRDAVSADVPAIVTELELLGDAGLDVLVDCTGRPEVGVRTARCAAAGGSDLVMVNVEADAVAGSEMAALVESAGGVYTLADGDQPSLIVGLADWAAGIGFEVVAAGKWTDAFSEEDAEGILAERRSNGEAVRESDITHFDGTKTQLELASAANCLRFRCDTDGMHGASIGLGELADRFRSRTRRALFSREHVVDYINCVGLASGESHPGGVFVVVRSDNRLGLEAMARKQCEVSEDRTHAAFYRPYHLIGVETVRSVVRAAVDRLPTAAPASERSVEVIAVAKRDMDAGTTLAGIGHDVRGVMVSAEDARSASLLPVGLAERCRLRRAVRKGDRIGVAEIDRPPDSHGFGLRADVTSAWNHE